MAVNPSRFQRRRRMSLVEQKIALERAYPGSFCTLKNNHLTWWCTEVRPTLLSRVYKIRITYDGWYPPRVTVYGESLQELQKLNFPHKYDVDPIKRMARVCLFLPMEFDYMKPFSDTLVPWTVEWLFHYEIWLSTGEWRGGGVHPTKGQKRLAPSSMLSTSSKG